MSGLFAFLLFLSLLSLLIGLIQPRVFKKLSKEGMTRKKIVTIFGIASFVLFFAFGFTVDTVTDVQSEQKEQVNEKTISPIEYLVLREWNPNNDSSSIGLEVLVNKKDVSKDNIITLAKSISLKSDMIVFKVYNTRDAWEAESNEIYGDVYNQGYLAFYVKNTTGSGAFRGFNEVRWFQEIGELQNLFGTKTQIRN